MKKIAITLCALAATAAFAATAFSTTLMTENFTYPNGGLTAANPLWVTFSGATDIQVVSGRATGGQALGDGDDAFAFTPQTLTVPTYYCADVQIADPGAGNLPKITYIMMLKDSGTSSFFGRLVVLPIAGGGFTFGVS